MRKWVEYNFAEDRIVEIDKNRLSKRAIDFQQACEEYKEECGVSGVTLHYKPYLESALKGEINSPVMERLPYTGEMRDRQVPEDFHSILNKFCDALESRPAVYGFLDNDIFFHHRDQFIKEENGRMYILEYFEDEA
jgi:hypothetical protein